jgi:hypothetical protein
MTSQPNTRQNPRMRDPWRFSAAPTGGGFPISKASIAVSENVQSSCWHTLLDHAQIVLNLLFIKWKVLSLLIERYQSPTLVRETALWLSLCPSKSYSGQPKCDCSDRDRAEPRWGRTIDRAGVDGLRRRATPS